VYFSARICQCLPRQREPTISACFHGIPMRRKARVSPAAVEVQVPGRQLLWNRLVLSVYRMRNSFFGFYHLTPATAPPAGGRP